MNRWLILCLMLFSVALHAEEPISLVQTRIAEQPPYQVGSTLRLEIDLLTSSWFTQAPKPPSLKMPGALITSPTGQADKLNLTIDGQSYFGLRLTYLISPTQAGEFTVPVLDFSLTMGQASAPRKVHSQELSFNVRAVSGAQAESGSLVAQSISFKQQIEQSSTPLKVGDSITRRITTEAAGAQAMLIPPIEFVPIDGLKRYLQPSEVSSLNNGRGVISGGARTDSVSYVIEQAGSYELPSLQLQWWDSQAGKLRLAEVPTVEFKAQDLAAYTLPFSLEEDLRRLGRNSRIMLSGRNLGWFIVLLLSVSGLYLGRYPLRRRWQALRRYQGTVLARWRNSETFAWQQLQDTPKQAAVPLAKLYAWLQRSPAYRGDTSLLAQLPEDTANLLQQQLSAQYAAQHPPAPDASKLRRSILRFRQALRRKAKHCSDQDSLRPLNPKR